MGWRWLDGRDGALRQSPVPRMGTAFPFLGWLCILFGPLCVSSSEGLGCCLQDLHQVSFPNPPPHPAEKSAPCPRTISFLPCCRISPSSQAGVESTLPRNNTPSRAVFSYTNDFLLPPCELISIPKRDRVDRCGAGPMHGSRFLFAGRLYFPV